MFKFSVAANQRHLLGNGLGDYQTVVRVVVIVHPIKGCQCKQVFLSDVFDDNVPFVFKGKYHVVRSLPLFVRNLSSLKQMNQFFYAFRTNIKQIRIIINEVTNVL
jgi:hypothetical protein